MSRAPALLAGAGMLLSTASAHACACGVPGLDTPLTTAMDGWGLRASEGARLATGRMDGQGRYRRFSGDERNLRYETQLLAAYRLVPRLELSSSLGLAREADVAGAQQTSSSGPSDSWARLRFDAFDETPVHRAGAPLPALSFTGSLRAPTAKAGRELNIGLGAWEAAAGLALERSVSARWRVGLSAEGALRAPDRSLGIERRLGPRLTTQAAAWCWPRPTLAFSLSSNLTWEGDAAVRGVAQPGSASRMLQLGAGIVYALPGSVLRPGLAVRQSLPVTGASINSLVATTVELSLSLVSPR